MIHCPGCFNDNSSSNNFCNFCGFALRNVICTNCQTAIDALEPFCPNCSIYLERLLVGLTRTADLEIEAIINDRYRVKEIVSPDKCLLVDTKPNHSAFPDPHIFPSRIHPALSLYQNIADHPGFPRIYDCFCTEDRSWVLFQALRDKGGRPLITLPERWRDLSLSHIHRVGLLIEHLELFGLLSTVGASCSCLNLSGLFLMEGGHLMLETVLLDPPEAQPGLSDLASAWHQLVLEGVEYSDSLAAFKLITRMKEDAACSIESVREELGGLRGAAKRSISLSHCAETNIGRNRSDNEDNYFALKCALQQGGVRDDALMHRGLYVVCDGMGGHEAGEVASELAVNKIKEQLLPLLANGANGQESVEREVVSAIMNANDAIYELNEQEKKSGTSRMGSTVVLALLIDHDMYVAHVGDSRLYSLSASKGIVQITADHNIANRYIKFGLITPEEAENHPEGKILTQALGPKSNIFLHPETTHIKIAEDVILVLCSDGLTDLVTARDIEAGITSNDKNLEAVVSNLIDLANERGGHDNITVVLVAVSLGRAIFPDYTYALEAESVKR